MSKKSWPILYCKLLYKMGQVFLDRQSMLSKKRGKSVFKRLNKYFEIESSIVKEYHKKNADQFFFYKKKMLSYLK